MPSAYLEAPLKPPTLRAELWVPSGRCRIPAAMGRAACTVACAQFACVRSACERLFVVRMSVSLPCVFRLALLLNPENDLEQIG